MNLLFRMANAIVVFFAIFSNAYGLPGESIVLDPNTGNYRITYFGHGSPGNKKSKPLRQVTFEPATKINPVVGSTFKSQGMDVVAYYYRVKNNSNSRQSLISFIIDPVSSIVTPSPLPKLGQEATESSIEQFDKIGRAAINTPPLWDGSVLTNDAGGLRITWGYLVLNTTSAGLVAGLTQGGFGFSSKDIPGIEAAQLSGHSPVLSFVDEGPSGEIADQLDKLTQNDFVPRNAAVPTIAVPEPFDAAILLDRIRNHVASWPSKQLADPAFAAQLDRYLVAAAEAFRLNNAKAGKEHIETVRRMLVKEHHNVDHDEEDSDDAEERKATTHFTIDRLAARVLDFDLRYVLKRTGHGHEEGERKKGRD